MRAIILAAGKGGRLKGAIGDLPKCLAPMGDRTLLDYQLKGIRSLGVRDVVLVLGYEMDRVIERLPSYWDINFTVVKNTDYETTNTAYSLWMARHGMTDDFLYLNGDVLFHPEVLRRLVRAYEPNTLAVERKPCGEEEVKVLLDGARIREIGKDIPPKAACGEFVGLAKFSKEIGPAFSRALEGIIDGGSKMAYFESALNGIAPTEPLTAVDITDLPCVEIDFPEDLKHAQEVVLPRIEGEARAKRQKVLFYVERNLHLPFLEPIHDYMVGRYPVDAVFSAPPFRLAQSGRPGVGLEADQVERLKKKARFIENARDFEADVAVVADACFFLVRHCKKVVNVGHGLISKGCFYTDAPIVRRENLADLTCVPGTWHRDVLRKNVFSPIQVTGFIKSDALLGPKAPTKRAFCRKHGISPDRKIVLFAPTFNEEMSAVPCVRERIAELADDQHGPFDQASRHDRPDNGSNCIRKSPTQIRTCFSWKTRKWRPR